MAVYPRTEHLKVPMILSSLIGIFPYEWIFDGNPCLRKCYIIYSVVMLSYYILFLIRAYVKLFAILGGASPQMDEISENLCITLIYTVTTVRQLIIKLHPGIRSLIMQIIQREQIIDSTDDEKVKNIFRNYAIKTNNKCKMYALILSVIASLYMVRPLFLVGHEKRVSNETVFVKFLPMSVWLPFDDQSNYLAAYIWQLLDCSVGAAFVTYTDILMFSLIVYPSGQVMILQYILKSFDKQKKRLQKEFHIEDDDTAAYVTFKECIRQHHIIIKYVDNFNDSMSILMIFDFLQSSLQIATTLMQIRGHEITLMLLIVIGGFFISMILRLYFYYYYANEIIVMSERLATSIYESNWYEQPPNVKFMMLIFVMRVRKPLMLKIGPFGVMSLDSFIRILKATYSYVMIML